MIGAAKSGFTAAPSASRRARRGHARRREAGVPGGPERHPPRTLARGDALGRRARARARAPLAVVFDDGDHAIAVACLPEPHDGTAEPDFKTPVSRAPPGPRTSISPARASTAGAGAPGNTTP